MSNAHYDLRQFIRGILSEMPFAGVMTPKRSKDYEKTNSYLRASDSERKKLDIDAQTKFHTSTKFLESARKVFESFPQNVWILPVSGQHGEIRRSFDLYQDEAIEFLRENVEDVNLDEISEKLSTGATIFVSFIREMSSGFLPTAWMIIHALLDDLEFDSPIGELSSLCRSVDKIVNTDDMKFLPSFVKSMTMNSATKGHISPFDEQYSEAVAEIITQEVATNSGFHLNITQEALELLEEEEQEEFLQLAEDLEDLVKTSNIKQRVIASLGSKKGMLVVVQSVI